MGGRPTGRLGSPERRKHCAAHPWLPGNPAVCYRPRRSRFIWGMSVKDDPEAASRRHQQGKEGMNQLRIAGVLWDVSRILQDIEAGVFGPPVTIPLPTCTLMNS